MTKELGLLERVYASPGVEQWEVLGNGLPASVFPAVAELMGFPSGSFAELLGLRARTLRNRKTKTVRNKTMHLTAEEAERSFRAYRVFRRAAEILGGDEEARTWLSSPKRALGNRRPVELLSRDVGAEEVLNLLGAIDEGVYA
jgi:putative toxin-antitoxin system antitoxin component (TIGR02293 family)